VEREPRKRNIGLVLRTSRKEVPEMPELDLQPGLGPGYAVVFEPPTSPSISYGLCGSLPQEGRKTARRGEGQQFRRGIAW
jgi:hypothetical protein